MFLLTLGFISITLLPVQQPCTALTGIVQDQSAALVPGATLILDRRSKAFAAADGRFTFACVTPGNHHLSITAGSFESVEREVTLPLPSPLVVKLLPETVETTLDVSGSAEAHSGAGSTHTLSGSQLQTLAGDPDDLLRQLQQLAASVGANPSSMTIAVDGFQDSTQVPPKDQIESVTIDPDLYSAEYGQPPYNGGRVEIRTKPGQKALHGSLFAVNGNPFENARDPFSLSKAAIGKKRYGGELTGPITEHDSDFLVGVEYRAIDNFGVVNALTLDGDGNPVPVNSNVATPERLWLPTARLDWQLGPKNMAAMSFTGSNNTLQNVGAVGLTLAEGGYASMRYDNVLRLSDYTTLSAKRLLESRFSLRWDGESDKPNSNAPQLQVAGSFTGGGSALGDQRLHELKVEWDEDALFTFGHHTLKIGSQMFISRENDSLTTGVNGSYLFGGGIAPALDASNQPISGQSTIISGLEQYRRSILHLAGGNPTTFQVVTGTPALRFTQFSDALFAQDEWDATKQLHLSLGLRYYAQTEPTSLSAITPRIGVTWSPSAEARWTVHAHAGLFGSTFTPAQQTEVLRLNGRDRINNIFYNPTYSNPTSGVTPVSTINSFAPNFTSSLSSTENVGGTYTLPLGWQFSGDLSFGRILNAARMVNVNSPLDDSPFGPRLGAPNANILQEQNSGKGRLDIEFVGFSHQGPKWAPQVFFGAVRIHRIDDIATPQDSLSDAGEFARSDGQPVFQAFGNGLFKLPIGLELSTDLYVSAGVPFNVVTGFDNNGDGDFNDRPQFATPAQPGAIATSFGCLVSSGGSLILPRNRGTLPPSLKVDMNLQRRFVLGGQKDGANSRAFTLNVRSANVTNHLNITGVGNVLESPFFGQPYQGDSGRRVEAGLRFTF